MKRIYKIIFRVLVFLLCAIFLFPIIISVINSFIGVEELYSSYVEGNKNYINILPQCLSIEQYYILLIEQTQYIDKLWISFKYSCSITVIHMIIALTTGFVFAKIKFKLRDGIFLLFIIVMMMPFQVTLLPNYIMLSKLNLINTDLAIILPSIFAPFGIFLMRQTIKCIDDVYIEAVIIESDKFIDIIKLAIFPYAKSGLVVVIVLTFCDTWNMVEQPLVLLKDFVQYPLSVLLNSMMNSSFEVAFAGSVFYMIPIIILFFYCEDELFQGIKEVTTAN